MWLKHSTYQRIHTTSSRIFYWSENVRTIRQTTTHTFTIQPQTLTSNNNNWSQSAGRPSEVQSGLSSLARRVTLVSMKTGKSAAFLNLHYPVTQRFIVYCYFHVLRLINKGNLLPSVVHNCDCDATVMWLRMRINSDDVVTAMLIRRPCDDPATCCDCDCDVTATKPVNHRVTS